MKIFNPHVSRSFTTKSLLLVCIISTLAISVHYVQDVITEPTQNSVITISTAQNKQKENPFKDIVVEAKSVYVYDVAARKVLYEKNADSVVPLASITKIMTALVAEERLSGEKIVIKQDAFGEYGENKLLLGDSWSFKNLIGYMLTVSSNDGARAVASAFQSIYQVEADGLPSASFEELMNSRAKELGLNSMRFNNPTGLDLEEQGIAGGYGNAKDVAKLFEYTLKNHSDLLVDTTKQVKYFYSDTGTLRGENTNTITNKIPNPLASKTGYTTLAGGNLAVVFDKGLGEPVIIVALGSSFDGRFSDVQRLAEATMESYNDTK